jgi:large subunit ribosomal protein L15
MATRKRRVRKQRGSRSCGWGTCGQHRDAGMKGGRGKSGMRKHKWTYVIRYGLTRRKIGFSPIKEIYKKPPINIGELDSRVDKLIAQGLAEKKGQKIEIDLTKLGYEKLLGSGKISRPIDLKVMKCSENAAKKIEEAGGSIISISKE